MSSQNNMSQYKEGRKFGEWELKRFIDAGGNGEVWEAIHPDRNIHAIKILKKSKAESYDRFKIEVEILEKFKHIEGVVPLVDKYLPSEFTKKDPAWFVMPLAQPFEEYRKGRKPERIVDDFINLAKTIEILHNEKVSHRDIKPNNFLYFRDRLCLSDFGLVKYPERPTITEEKRDIGAKFTMAPEMRREAYQADGLPADVYSFAKSLWIALTGQNLGFDGQYNPNSNLALRIYLQETYTTTLDQLLVKCTDNNPSQRPSISQVIVQLRKWLDLINDFHAQNLTEWKELQRKLFPLGTPVRTTWIKIDDICTVLSEIAKVPALNHMFYPTSGGNTITSVSRAAEPDMIELHVDIGIGDIVDILKPAKLTYESFGDDTRWNYFRLEAASIQPIGIAGSMDSDGIREMLTEVRPGEYNSPNCLSYDCDDNGNPLSKTARLVYRYLNGCFVFFSTRSSYNLDSSTYDGRHNNMTEDQFRNYISRCAKVRNQNSLD